MSLGVVRGLELGLGEEKMFRDVLEGLEGVSGERMG